MPLIVNANMKMFAEGIGITSSRMIQDYGLSTVDEIIEAEAERGNSKAIEYARHYYHSPARLIKLFGLTNVENRFVLLHNMDDATRRLVLPKLSRKDLSMGLYFFTQEKLLQMLMKTDIQELVNVVREAFPLETIVSKFTENDLAQFFHKRELEKTDVIKQLKSFPPEIMKEFVESVTGMPANQTNPNELITQISNLPTLQYRKFMSNIDPKFQRQLTYQLTKEKPEYLTLFENETYVKMLETIMKPDMVKPMIMLSKESLVDMISELPSDLMSIVAAQIDTADLAAFIQKGHMDLIEDALMI